MNKLSKLRSWTRHERDGSKLNVEANKAIIQKIIDATRNKDQHLRHLLLWKECEAIRANLHGFESECALPKMITSYVNDALPRFYTR